LHRSVSVTKEIVKRASDFRGRRESAFFVGIIRRK
jgi:hypothetical protein